MKNETTKTDAAAIAGSNMLLPVFSFGEKGVHDQWYAHDDQVHIKCNEETINHLWKQWIMNPTAKRADDDKYVIFKVTEPAMSLNGL